MRSWSKILVMLVACASCSGPSQACGGFAGKSCPDSQVCLDDPNDACKPDAGATDCPGLCYPK